MIRFWALTAFGPAKIYRVEKGLPCLVLYSAEGIVHESSERVQLARANAQNCGETVTPKVHPEMYDVISKHMKPNGCSG